MKNNDSLGFKIFAVSAFLVVGLIGIILAVNPIEWMKVRRDAQRLQEAKLLVSTIRQFYSAKGRLPWVSGLVAESSTLPLKWTSYAMPEIGVCADSKCETPGELAQFGGFSSEFLQGAKTAKSGDGLMVGRGKRPGDAVYVCFVPGAQDARKATGKLYKLKVDTAMPPSGQPAECGDNVSWEEEDVCYVCVQ